MYTLAPSCHGKPVLFTWRVPSWRASSSLAGPVYTGTSSTRRISGTVRLRSPLFGGSLPKMAADASGSPMRNEYPTRTSPEKTMSVASR
jgi:hypothetical protein